MDGSEEVASGFVVACGDGAELFKFGEEILDQVSSFVKFLVVEALLFAIGFRWNDGEFTGFLQRFEHPLVGIEAFIGDHRARFDASQQDVGSIQFTGLFFAPFLRAPALCWWARTMVESIMAYSLSASLARCWKTFSHTPRAAQRLKRVCTTRKSQNRSGRSRHGIPAR